MQQENQRRRVVVTGLGAVCSLGLDVNELWRRLLAGHSGTCLISRFDTNDLPSKVAAEIKNFNALDYLDRKEIRRIDLSHQYVLVAASQAFADSELMKKGFTPERAGAIIGHQSGGITSMLGQYDTYLSQGYRRLSPFLVAMMFTDMAPGLLSIKFNLKAANYAISSACASSANALCDAFRIIKSDEADIMVAGGTDAPIVPFAIAGFSAIRAISARNDQPEKASKPFDKDRDGFVLGEGSAVLILEELGHAQRRGARIYAELTGYGMSGDAYHITSPNTDGPKRSMLNALRNAGLNPQDVQYVNAHGTSTPMGDKNETDAIKLAFGDHAKKLVVNSTKSMTGHLLGGAGGIESIFCALAVHHQISPPTINIFEQDPECDLDFCANIARDIKIDVAVNNNFGFGGTNGSLVFRRV